MCSLVLLVQYTSDRSLEWIQTAKEGDERERRAEKSDDEAGAYGRDGRYCNSTVRIVLYGMYNGPSTCQLVRRSRERRQAVVVAGGSVVELLKGAKQPGRLFRAVRYGIGPVLGGYLRYLSVQIGS